MDSLRALFKGISVVFSTIPDSQLPPFDLDRASPYDETTYAGRARHFYGILDPMCVHVQYIHTYTVYVSGIRYTALRRTYDIMHTQDAVDTKEKTERVRCNTGGI